MSQVHCPYCGGAEGRCVSVDAGRFITECKGCGRVVDERHVEVEELFVERGHDNPLCIVTPDFSENEQYKAPPIEDDPFESIGFITAFSTWSLELAPLFTTTCSTFSGHLAELERVLTEFMPAGGFGNSGPGVGAGPNLSGSVSLVDMLRAYFQIVEVSSVLGLERDSCDHAIQLFRDCSLTTYLRNRNIEALATAALVQASREAQEPRTLQEISAAANIPQKEIARHMKVLTDALKLSQPINSNSISVHMPRFCSLLQLNKATQDLATYIGEVVISKSFCTRRNPISISAAAIYLACQLEDKRKTQTEICKATGLTEVTLRKVYKELLENLDDLLPRDYTPAVPPEKAFPATGTLGRLCATRVSTGVNISTSATESAGIPSASGLVDLNTNPNSMVGSFSSGAVQRNLPSHLRGSDIRSGNNPFAMPGAVSSSYMHPSSLVTGGSENTDKRKTWSQDQVEKGRERLDMDLNSCSDNLDELSSNPDMPSIRPSFFPFANVEQRTFQELGASAWPPQAMFNLSARRHDEGKSGQFIDRRLDKSRSHHGQQKGKEESHCALPASIQLKLLQSVGARTASDLDSRNSFDREITRDRDGEREQKDNSSGFLVAKAGTSASSINAFATAAAAAGAGGGGQGFPPMMWAPSSAPCSGPLNLFPPHTSSCQSGTVESGKGNNSSVENKMGTSESWAPPVQHSFLSSFPTTDRDEKTMKLEKEIPACEGNACGQQSSGNALKLSQPTDLFNARNIGTRLGFDVNADPIDDSVSPPHSENGKPAGPV